MQTLILSHQRNAKHFYLTPVKWLRKQVANIGGDWGGLGTVAEDVN